MSLRRRVMMQAADTSPAHLMPGEYRSYYKSYTYHDASVDADGYISYLQYDLYVPLTKPVKINVGDELKIRIIGSRGFMGTGLFDGDFFSSAKAGEKYGYNAYWESGVYKTFNVTISGVMTHFFFWSNGQRPHVKPEVLLNGKELII